MVNNFLQTKLVDLVNAYKLSALLSMLAVKKNDYKSLVYLNTNMKTVWEDILGVMKKSASASVYSKLKRMEFDKLPEEFSVLNIIDIYNKLISLKYLEFETDDLVEKVNLAKMSIGLNPTEELTYIDLAKNLYKLEKYPEVIELCEYIKTFSESAPVWEILGDVYRKLGVWGKAIEGYKNYIAINDGDLEVAEKLEETYKEALK